MMSLHDGALGQVVGLRDKEGVLWWSDIRHCDETLRQSNSRPSYGAKGRSDSCTS